MGTSVYLKSVKSQAVLFVVKLVLIFGCIMFDETAEQHS